MATNLGDAVLKQLSTSRLYWLPAGDTGHIDFGNVTQYKDDPKVERVEHMQSKKGYKRVDFALIKGIGSKKSFTLDEHFNHTLRQLLLSAVYANVVQAEGLTADEMGFTADRTTFTADVGGTKAVIAAPTYHRVYDLGAQDVTITSAVDNNNAALVAGVDYVLDAAAGMFTVLQVAPAAPWTIIFTQLAVTDLQFQMFSKLLSLGTFKHVEFDQFSSVAINTETFSGQVYVTAWGDNKTDAFNEFVIEVITANNVRKQRST